MQATRCNEFHNQPGGSGLADRVSALEAQVARLTAALRDLGAEV